MLNGGYYVNKTNSMRCGIEKEILIGK